MLPIEWAANMIQFAIDQPAVNVCCNTVTRQVRSQILSVALSFERGAFFRRATVFPNSTIRERMFFKKLRQEF